MKNIFKKTNKVIITGLIFLIIIIAFLYSQFKTCETFINSIASILAIPAFLTSIIVLSVISIKPENLDSYYKKRVVHDNQKKAQKNKAKIAFDEELNKIITLNEKYKNFYNNINNNINNSKQIQNECSRNLDELKSFISKTEDYIFKNFLPSLENTGELDKFFDGEISLVTLKEHDVLTEKLNILNPDLFKYESFNEDDIALLKILFNAKATIPRYLDTCTSAYELMKEE